MSAAKEKKNIVNLQPRIDSKKDSSTIDAFLSVLENDDHFSDVQFNLLTNSPERVVDGVPTKWTDADDSKTRHYIEKQYGLYSPKKCDDAIRIFFQKKQYHPLKELIESLTWDGTERISSFLQKWTLCEDDDYTKEVSRLIFAGGIHRLYNPGCKFDDMPVLVGTKQGEGKSTFIRWLAMKDEYYAEVNEFEGKSSMEALEGAWICEVSELLAMTKAKEQEAVKAFLTRQNDRYRTPYDKRVSDHLRKCIFIGTTNKAQFLTDKTGGRRFYPVKVNQSGYDLFDKEEEIKEEIKQCWAEAYQKYKDGELKPFASRNLQSVIRENQTAATEDDYRVGMIEGYLEGKNETFVLEIWQYALKMTEFSKPSKKESNEISLIMQSMPGWEKQKNPKRFFDFGPQRWWKKIDDNRSDDIEDGLPL